MSANARKRIWRLVAVSGVTVAGAVLSAPAGAVLSAPAGAVAPQRPQSAPVSHPQDDHAGSTIAAHEGQPSVTAAVARSTAWRVRGLDVSHWQGDISWPAVYFNGGRFVYIKATESTTFTDPNFSRNYTRSAAAGLVRGAYHFALPDRSSGGSQADYLVNHGGGWSADGKTLPPMLDIEYNPYGPTCYGLSAKRMVIWIQTFSNRVHNRTGRYPTIYTTTDWWATCTGNDPGLGGTNPLFIARWSSTVGALPAGWASYTIWQYVNSGPLPGDQDRFNGSLSRLRAFASSGL